MANQDEKFRKTFNQDEKVRGLSQHTLFTFVPILKSTAIADFLFPLAQFNKTSQKRNGIEYVFLICLWTRHTNITKKCKDKTDTNYKTTVSASFTWERSERKVPPSLLHPQLLREGGQKVAAALSSLSFQI